ncbi:hypothetical protein [Lacticaseibacillus pantheris]|uniref:hypothetical protein n=1 Tax=Lacticaseibacillus pantheris TaxID=171523 RepID=UPI0006D050B4|nr:hypothetical protein [Lacticaseibacillus pantheris]
MKQTNQRGNKVVLTSIIRRVKLYKDGCRWCATAAAVACGLAIGGGVVRADTVDSTEATPSVTATSNAAEVTNTVALASSATSAAASTAVSSDSGVTSPAVSSAAPAGTDSGAGDTDVVQYGSPTTKALGSTDGRQQEKSYRVTYEYSDENGRSLRKDENVRTSVGPDGDGIAAPRETVAGLPLDYDQSTAQFTRSGDKATLTEWLADLDDGATMADLLAYVDDYLYKNGRVGITMSGEFDLVYAAQSRVSTGSAASVTIGDYYDYTQAGAETDTDPQTRVAVPGALSVSVEDYYEHKLPTTDPQVRTSARRGEC